MYEYMSIYKNRLVRQMYKDVYLPIVCNATKTQFYSLLGECVCMTTCRFNRELGPSQDFLNSEWVKDLESQKNSGDLPTLTRKEES